MFLLVFAANVDFFACWQVGLHIDVENLIVPPAKAGKLINNNWGRIYSFEKNRHNPFFTPSLVKPEFYLDNGWLGCFRSASALENTQDRTHYFMKNSGFTFPLLLLRIMKISDILF